VLSPNLPEECEKDKMTITKKILSAGALLTMAASLASATTMTAVGQCAAFSYSSFPNSTAISCPSFTSLAGAGSTFAGTEYLVYESDYSSGTVTPVSEISTFSFGSGFTNTADTLTSTGGSNSSGAVSTDSATFQTYQTGPPAILSGFTDSITGVSYVQASGTESTAFTSGGALGVTGYVYVVATYTTSATPEPATMALTGGALVLVASFRRRRKTASKV